MKQRALRILASLLLLAVLCAPIACASQGGKPRQHRGSGRNGSGGRHGVKADQQSAVTLTIIEQPEAVMYQIEGSGYDAPVFSTSVALPVGIDALSFRWYVDGIEANEEHVVQSEENDAVTSTFAAAELTGKPSGLYPVYCVVKADAGNGQDVASTTSCTVNFIVCKGILPNSVITFSDVHEKWDHIGTAIRNTISETEGRIPAMMIVTGDFSNGGSSGASSEYARECIERQLGGIEAVWVSGNHDDEIVINQGSEANSADDLGILYDSRKANNPAISGLIVIGLDYANLQPGSVHSAVADYGAVEDADSACEQLKDVLDAIAADYHGELILISAHAGLHVLGVEPASGADVWAGGSEYNISHSADLAQLINCYAEAMDIMFLFGHNHSKAEREFVKLPGDSLICTTDSSVQTQQEVTLRFSYVHAGYLTDAKNGLGLYTCLTWDANIINRAMHDLSGSTLPELSLQVVRK